MYTNEKVAQNDGFTHPPCAEIRVNTVRTNILRLLFSFPVCSTFLEQYRKNEQHVLALLQPLMDHHVETVEHQLRTTAIALELLQHEASSNPLFVHSMKKETFSEIAYAFFLAALLHDIGKSMTALTILNGHAPLSQGERKHIENHAREGFDRTKAFNLLCAKILIGTHEWSNGYSYPRKELDLSRKQPGVELTLSTLLALADAVDALWNRPYVIKEDETVDQKKQRIFENLRQRRVMLVGNNIQSEATAFPEYLIRIAIERRERTNIVI